MLCHRYSNLAYSRTTIDSASFPMILEYYWKFNTLLYYNVYSNLDDLILLLQQPTIHDLIQQSLCYDIDTTT
jgi:hypothetical protein